MRKLQCVVALSMLGTFVCLQSVYGKSITIGGERLNVRSGPGRTFNIVDVVNKHEKFEVLDEKDGWMKISVEGSIGWIPKKAVSTDAASFGKLLEQADDYFYRQQFTTPPDANAYDLYRDVLELDPENAHALQRIRQMTQTYKRWADAAYNRQELEKAKIFYQRYLFLTPEDAAVEKRLKQIHEGGAGSASPLRVLHLRSRPSTVDAQQLRRMLTTYRFHHPADWSKHGLSQSISGDFRHDYVRKEFEGVQVLIDYAGRLMWQRPESPEEMTWEQASQYVVQLNAGGYAGFSDWRLPTIEELASLMEGRKTESGLYLSPLFGPTPLWCWSADYSPMPGKVWFISFNSGGIQQHAIENTAFVLAVRSEG
ncbi:MAG: DUF1566 domain-containing protein [bacterium]|nr:DUF1566 domain-containing protein [bacterium]